MHARISINGAPQSTADHLLVCSLATSAAQPIVRNRHRTGGQTSDECFHHVRLFAERAESLANRHGGHAQRCARSRSLQPPNRSRLRCVGRRRSSYSWQALGYRDHPADRFWASRNHASRRITRNTSGQTAGFGFVAKGWRSCLPDPKLPDLGPGTQASATTRSAAHRAPIVSRLRSEPRRAGNRRA